jgi:hypothetical protein
MLLMGFGFYYEIVGLQISASVIEDGEESEVEVLRLVKQLAVEKILIFAFEQKDGHVGVDLKMGDSPLYSQRKGCVLKLPV